MLKNPLKFYGARRAISILFCALLAACGGGGGGGDSAVNGANTNTPPPPSSGSGSPAASGGTSVPISSNPPLSNTAIGIISDGTHVTAGGGGIRFQVSGTASGDTAQWSLKPGDPGSLANATGATVTYNPPLADSISADTTVSISVNIGEASATTRLLLLAATPTENVSPSAPPPSVFAVAAQSERTAAGGAPVTLIASKPSSGGTVAWSLEEGSPGTLSALSGDSVQYLPPAAGTIVNTVSITVNATLGAEAKKTSIALEGTQGLSLLAGNDGGMGNRNGAGTAARFYNPKDVASDARGNTYVADTYNRTIRRIASDGVVTTFAGSPYDPFSGSVDGTGISARFSDPRGITVDSTGNIYVADAMAIRKITPAGIVTTLAGNAGAAGNTDGPGDQARFNAPYRLTADVAGNIFVTDSGSVRKITPAGLVSTVARTDRTLPPPSQMLNAVRGIAVDRSGNLFVVDAYDQNSARDISYASSSIRKITPDGVVTTLAGVHGTLPLSDGATGSNDGAGTVARFNFPDGITIDASDNLFVSDTGNRTIRRVTPAGVVTTIAGTAGLSGNADGTGAAARFLAPSGITAASDGILHVADSVNNTIRKVSADGDVVTVAGKPAMFGSRDGMGASALFWTPTGIAADGRGNMYIADKTNNTIRRISQTGEVTTIAGTSGQSGAVNGVGPAARFNRPGDIAADSIGNLYIVDEGNNLIRRIALDGTVSTLTQYSAIAITVDSTNNVYAVGFNSPTVRKITPAGVTTDISMLISPETTLSIADIVSDGAGNLYAATSDGIRKMTPAGEISLVGPQARPTGSTVIRPLQSITIDQEGNLYTNPEGGRLRRTTQAGSVSEVFDLEPLGFMTGFLGERKYFEMVAPKTIAITVSNGVYLLRLP